MDGPYQKKIVPKQTKDMEHYELTKSFHFYSFTQKLMMSSSFSFKLDCGGSFPMNSNWKKKRLGKNAPKTPLFTNSYSFCHIMVTIRFLLTWTQSLNLTLDLCWINRKKCNELWVVLNKEKNIITLRRSPALKPLSKIAGCKRPALVKWLVD